MRKVFLLFILVFVGLLTACNGVVALKEAETNELFEDAKAVLETKSFKWYKYSYAIHTEVEDDFVEVVEVNTQGQILNKEEDYEYYFYKNNIYINNKGAKSTRTATFMSVRDPYDVPVNEMVDTVFAMLEDEYIKSVKGEKQGKLATVIVELDSDKLLADEVIELPLNGNLKLEFNEEGKFVSLFIEFKDGNNLQRFHIGDESKYLITFPETVVAGTFLN